MSKNELQPRQKEETTEVQLPGLDLNKAMGIVEQFLDNQKDTNAEQLRIEDAENERQFKLDLNLLGYDKLRFVLQFGLLALVTLVLLTVAVALFFKGNITAAGLIVSHLGAVLLGLLAGMGMDKSKRREYVQIEEDG